MNNQKTVMPPTESQFVVFSLDAQRYAIPVAAVQRIVRAVRVTPLGGIVSPILGLINVHGRIIQVASMRRLQGKQEREIGSADQFIIITHEDAELALLVDEVLDVTGYGVASITPAATGTLGASPAVIKDNVGMIIFCEPQDLFAGRLQSPEEMVR